MQKRMKHNHSSWSIKGGNHLAKILAKKCSGRLNEVSERLKSPRFEGTIIQQIQKEVMSAGSIPEKAGKGYHYPVEGHLRRLDGSCGITHRTMLAIAGYGD